MNTVFRFNKSMEFLQIGLKIINAIYKAFVWMIEKNMFFLNKIFLTEKGLYVLIFAVAQIAQSVEQGIENPRVGGSIPSLGTIFKFQNCFHNALVVISF